jgi:2',3'-cyclic-nucleotide 2'-phosphodiesterase (5'-nucleotidase family)
MKPNARNRWLALGIVLLVLTLVLPMAALAGPPSPNADDHAFHKTITVVEINDLHGALVGSVQSWSHGDAVGGVEWVAGYFNIIWEENPGGVLFLDGGDMMQGTLISNYFEGASTIEALNEMGIDASVVGNHEFDWGIDVLLDRMHQAHFPILTANTFLKGTDERPDWAIPYVIKPVKGIKVGLVGVTTVDTPATTNPINIAHLDFRDPAPIIMELVPEMEAEGATVIIVLAHMGGFWPLDPEDEVYNLATGLDSEHIDLIVSGHTHSDLREVVNGIPVVQAYSSGTAFSRVDFTVDKRTGEAVAYYMNPYPTTTYQTYYGNPASYQRWDTGEWVTVVPDPEVEAIVDYYEAEIEDLKNEVIGCAASDITRNYRYESEMGDWVTDIMRGYDVDGDPATVDIDFALTNSGGLRADIDASDITFGEVFEAIPFDNTLVVVELDGGEVRQVLEEGITGEHGVVQVSGLQFTFGYDAPVGSRIVGDVVDLSTDLPLDPTQTYYVAVNDFMASGGDDYDTLPANPQLNTYVLVRDIVVDWVKAAGCFDPPDPAVEQRITALGTPPD